MRHFIETTPREMVEQQDTMPLPVIKLVYVRSDGLLTLRQVRERCGLNQVQLAQAAGVRPIVVDWYERGRAVQSEEAARILAALARVLVSSSVRRRNHWEGGQR